MKKRVLLSAASAVLFSFQAHAAIVDADAKMTGFSVSTTGSATFDFTFGVSDWFTAEALANDFTVWSVADSDAGSSYAEAAALSLPADGTTAESLAVSDALDIGASSAASALDAGDAAATTTGEMGYEVSGTGLVTLTFDVELFNSITGATGSEFASSAVTVSDSFSGEFSELAIDSDGFGGDIFDDLFDSISFSFDVDGFDEGFLYVETFALADTGVAPVPVPAAAWLFGTGLMALGAIARRRRKS